MRHCDFVYALTCASATPSTRLYRSLFLGFFSSLLLTPLSYLFLFVCLLFRLCLSAIRCKFYYESPRRITFPSEFVIVVTFLRYFWSESVDFCRFSSDNRHKMICENTSFRVLPFHVCFDRVYIRRVLTPLNAVFRIIPPPTLFCLAETRPNGKKTERGRDRRLVTRNKCPGWHCWQCTCFLRAACK